ncbi:hypothetical protein BDV97DRAFT_349987 [Delphinella strobiligena]|nr:hypothetical protein BDV97DRAFT_349987 [Delphinella strobiligena]
MTWQHVGSRVSQQGQCDNIPGMASAKDHKKNYAYVKCDGNPAEGGFFSSQTTARVLYKWCWSCILCFVSVATITHSGDTTDGTLLLVTFMLHLPCRLCIVLRVSALETLARAIQVVSLRSWPPRGCSAKTTQ